MLTTLRRLFRNVRGASIVEYAILLALIAGICIGVTRAVGTKTQSHYASVGCAGRSFVCSDDDGGGHDPGHGRH